MLLKETGADDLIVIMGARDNSLSLFASSLTCKNGGGELY
jgi:hypothetical protein